MKYKLTGFSYKDVLYEYVYENDIITGFSCNGNEVVRYVYTYDICEDVLGKNDSGEWISMLENSDFIGNVNPIRYNGYYYDKETKWYYVGRYYSAELNRFIDGVSPIRAIELKENYPSYIVDAKTYTIGVNFQGNKNSRAYYDEYVVAKVIQLESNYSTDDQDCVAWVIKNRMNDNNEFAGQNTAYEVVTAADQFSAYTSDGFNDFLAYASMDTWVHAMELEECLENGNMPSKPYGYNNQMYFSSIGSFYRFVRYDNDYFYYNNGMRVSDAFVLGWGQLETSNFMVFPSGNYVGKFNVFCKKEFAGSY